MGCVLPAGLGQAPARQAARGAGLSDATRATTVNKMCGSGMQAAILGHDLLAAGSADAVIAGGMESMSRARICWTGPAPDIAWDMAGSWITCSWMVWRMPTNPVA